MSGQDTIDRRSESRTYPLRMPPNWQPPYPSFMSEFDADANSAAFAVMGAQFSGEGASEARNFIDGLAALMRRSANHVDLSFCERDSTGYRQMVATGYWLEPSALADFTESAAFRAYWSKNSGDQAFGIFREVFNVPLERFETLHSGPDHLVGVAHARSGLSDPIDTHAYWGSMRDRIPAAAHDRFDPLGDIEVIDRSPGRIVVRPGSNMAIIRSGQDIGPAEGVERREYYADVEPVLKAGMDFLRDKGRSEVNCHDCRFMALIDDDGRPGDHTYGLAYFRSLADLEQWSEHHPTHLAIFNAFLQFAPRYGPAMQSRYWHEVSVVEAAGQYAEYINCAAGTGLAPLD